MPKSNAFIPRSTKARARLRKRTFRVSGRVTAWIEDGRSSIAVVCAVGPRTVEAYDVELAGRAFAEQLTVQLHKLAPFHVIIAVEGDNTRWNVRCELKPALKLVETYTADEVEAADPTRINFRGMDSDAQPKKMKRRRR